jgi:hypothetical protein
MIEKKIERIDTQLKTLRTRIEFGGPEAHMFCEKLENVLRDLKSFDQKNYRKEQMVDDLNKRFEAIILSLEKIVKTLKDNRMI